jgi:molecular chaperone GrpE
MFPKKKENEKQKTEDGGQKTEPKPASAVNPELPGEATELHKQIESLKKEKDDLFAKLQRVAADYDNYQKRSARQLSDGINYEKDKIIKSLLPVLDNFEYILSNTACEVKDEALLKGVKIIYDHFLGVMKAQGVEQIQSAGEKFNPEHHEAITHRAEEGKENGIVLEELQKGYMSNGRVIRASRVMVNKLAGEKNEQTPVAESQQQDEEETKDTQ